jgi:predicted nucleic acid-binding protein
VITAVDTNVLLDVFGSDSVFGRASAEALSTALTNGQIIACEVVWAETAAFFPSAAETRSAMETLGLALDPVGVDAALSAGAAFKQYRRRGGKRDRMVADFLIGAHAREQADRLLTRDRGFFRTYYPRLKILDPTHQSVRED